MDPEAPSQLSTENSQLARVLRWVVSLVTLIICAWMQWWLVVHGRPDNILHQNAQFYGFVMIAAILGGLGIGETLNTLVATLKKP